jgi:hypothetical protein
MFSGDHQKGRTLSDRLVKIFSLELSLDSKKKKASGTHRPTVVGQTEKTFREGSGQRGGKMANNPFPSLPVFAFRQRHHAPFQHQIF